MLKPEISVIVLYHTGDFLEGFLESIKRSVDVSYEVIVVTSDKVKVPEGCVVVFSTAMPAEKRNIGVKFARGKYIAFFDDDTEIHCRCLLYFKDYLDKNPKVGMVYGKLWNAERRNRFDEAGGYLTSTGFIWSRAGQNDIDNGQYDKAEPILAGKSASCMIRKNSFIIAGGFDEEFGILGEETLLSWRVWLSGQEVHYVPEATGMHWFNTKRKDKEKHYTPSRIFFNGSRNYLTMLFMCLETKNLWKILPIHFLIWLTAGLAMIGTGKIRQGANILKGLSYFVGNFWTIKKKRNVIQKGRLVDDRTLFPLIFRRPPSGYYKQRFLRYISLGLHG